MSNPNSSLPYDIDAIEVHLCGFSKNGIFQGMVIEHPKDVRPGAIASEVPSNMTIGEFYLYVESRLRAAVEAHGESAIFCGDPQCQVPPDVFYYGGGGNVIEVHNLSTAIVAMKLITDQGEGTQHNIWVVGEDELAHYFRFSQLYHERLYKPGDTVASGPTGAEFPVPWGRAVMIDGNAKIADYPPGEIRDAIVRFNQRYCELLGNLQMAFTGAPDKLIAAVVAMCALRDDFRAITANPFPGKPLFYSAPTFEYSVTSQQPFAKQALLAASSTAGSSNEATLDQLQQAYSTGNLPLALACMTDNVIWDISGPSECPYLGVFYGHEGFSRFWTLLGDTVTFGSAGIERSFFSGNQAMSYGGEQGTTKPTRAPYHYDWAIRYEFNEQHQITLMRQYFNPLNILSALKAAPYPAPAACPHAANVHPLQQTGTMNMSSPQNDLPSIPAPFTMPFYYASLTNVGVYYLVPVSRVEPYLKGTGLCPALFGDKAMVSFNFQLYAGQFASGLNLPPEQWSSSGAAITQELELNIVAYPEKRKDQLAPVGYQAFIQDGDQTKLYGNHRVWVPCDAPIAIAAGEQLFGEPKFKTSFKVNLASQNPVRSDAAIYQPEWVETWGFRVDDPQDANTAIFTCIVNTLGIKAIPGNISPITEYGVHDGKLIGCRWNILQPMDTYFLNASHQQAVQLILGTSSHPMRKDLETLIGGCAPVAVQTLNSVPAAIQSRAYYP